MESLLAALCSLMVMGWLCQSEEETCLFAPVPDILNQSLLTKPANLDRVAMTSRSAPNGSRKNKSVPISDVPDKTDATTTTTIVTTTATATTTTAVATTATATTNTLAVNSSMMATHGFEEPILTVENVYPGSPETQNLYCYIKNRFAALSELQSEQAGQELRHKSCALVSTSGALEAHDQGELIDQMHDVILRFHSSPTIGYERFVGNRTDYSLEGSPTGISFNNMREGRLPVVGEVEQIAGKYLQDVVKDEFALLYPRRMGMHDVYEGEEHEPTTGCKGMLAAMANCKSLEAYEMTPSLQAADWPYHYYDNPWHGLPDAVKADDNPFHGMIKAEHDLWRRLSSGSVHDIENLGKTSYPGFKTVRCPGEVEHPGELGFWIK